MQISKQASKGHLVVGIILIVFSFSSLIGNLIFPHNILCVLCFFFGVWGGVEIGRYLEFAINTEN
jgi:hypothetical protein